MKRLGVLTILILLAAVFAHGEENRLIHEYESLRNSLSVQDPARLGMSLKLADLLFDESGKMANKIGASSGELLIAKNYRMRATALYQDTLKGSSYQPAITGSQKIKVQFQLARIYADLDQQTDAEKLWMVLIQQEDIPMIRKEAALRLAEMKEGDINNAASVKQADNYYQKAIQYCSDQDVCYYPHYRRGWLLHKLGAHDQALAELRQGIWDSQGNPREEVLRDLLLFLAEKPGPADAALAEVEAISKKLARPSLVSSLAEGYFSAGNKHAGMKVLEVVNEREPSLKYQAQLLEEYYGIRDWEKFRLTLSQIAMHGVSDTKTEEEKIFRRVVVQLDSERISQPQYADDFKKSVLTYLKLYPNSAERQKMQNGWLASETNDQAKIDQLTAWIALETPKAGAPAAAASAEEIRLRKVRAATAQKAGNQAIVVEEMAKLAAATPPSDPAAREYKYLQARALYEMKHNDEALPVFQQLAASGSDNWAIQSQHLSLDILNQQKNYSAIIAQTEVWTKNASLSKQASVAKEIPEVQKIAEQASFEMATSRGNTSQALEEFLSFCKNGKFTPKSCENAKVIAVGTKNEEALINILKLTNSSAELTQEYEAAGYFSEAAKLTEELAQKSSAALSANDQFKLALLYELADQNLDKNRVLLKLEREQIKAKTLNEDQENLLLSLLMDGKLIDYQTFQMKLSKNNERKLAHYLASNGQMGTHQKDIEKILLDSPEALGAAWSKLIVGQASKLNAEQVKIKFYGKQSKKHFESRIAMLKKLSDFGDHYLAGADISTRLELLALLKDSHESMATEVTNSPIPAGLMPEAVDQIKASLQEMAKPFQEKAKAYASLIASTPPVQDTIKTAAAAIVNPTQKSAALIALHHNPSDLVALNALKVIYESIGKLRLAAYFEGRTRQIQSGGAKS